MRVDWPDLLWRLVDDAPLVTAVPSAEVDVSGPDWAVGQLLQGQILASRDEQALLLVDGFQLWSVWPGEKPPVGQLLTLRVLGQTGGQWRLTRVQEEASSGTEMTLLALLEQLDWPLTYDHVQRLLDLLRGKRSWQSARAKMAGEGGAEPQELCPPNRQVWQAAMGFEPHTLATAFFTWQPFPCGVLVEKKRREQEADDDEGQPDPGPFCLLLVLQLPKLGQIEVVWRGMGAEQAVVFVAQEETARLLQKKEKELALLLRQQGIEVHDLSIHASAQPLVQVLPAAAFSYQGVDRQL